MLIDASTDPEYASVVRASLADKFSSKPPEQGNTLRFILKTVIYFSFAKYY
jgi:hypothetical protein